MAPKMDQTDQRVILLDPPTTKKNHPVRFQVLMVCPVCMDDYVLGTGEPLYCIYRGVERVVTVCDSCHNHPPHDYREILTHALDAYEWSDLREVILPQVVAA